MIHEILRGSFPIVYVGKGSHKREQKYFEEGVSDLL